MKGTILPLALVAFGILLIVYVVFTPPIRSAETFDKIGTTCTISKSMGSPQYKCLEELND